MKDTYTYNRLGYSRLSDESDEIRAYKRVLKRRGVDVPCEKCKGLGTFGYGSGSTYHGGMGVASIKFDVCNQCWGTGDKNKIGTNIKELETAQHQWEKEECVRYLSYSLGVTLPSMTKAIGELADFAEKQSRKRKLDFFKSNNWYSLSKILRGLIE